VPEVPPYEEVIVLSIRDLSKTYPGGVRALRNVSLDIPQGMFGLIGPNGAGKSTLMKILATLLEPDSGSAHLDSLDLIRDKDATRRLLGYLPQEFGVYPKMSAYDLLNHLAAMKGILNRGERKEVVEGLLHQTNLWELRKQALGTYSGGMKQRFGIAQALLANPQLIIVDEPTAGLDPTERNRFLNLLSAIGRNVVVILSTHIVDDVSELCSRMAIINNGELLLQGIPSEAIDKLKGRVWRKVVSTDEERTAIETAFQVISAHLVGGLHELRVYAESSPGDGFAPTDPNLEDVYFLNLSRHQSN
jgi:ABC-type multidrug transport system ATPase subunit